MRLEFKATKKQWELLKYLYDDIHTEIWYWWWAWWGKSYWWVFWVRSMCQKYPWTRRFFWRKELTVLRRTTLNTYFKFLADYQIPEVNRWGLNNQTNTIKFPNWSEILLLDLAWQPSDPLYTRFWSLELTGGFIDESNEIHNTCIDILKTRIGRQKNKEYWLKPKLLETFNPDKGHIYERYYKPYKSATLPEYRMFIPALATDNPHLDENYITQLQRADEITRQRLLLGNFDYDDTPGKLFRWDEISDLFTNNVEDWDYYISADIARLWDDKTVIVVWRWLKAVLIVSYNWLTTDQTVERIKELEQKYNVSRYKIVIDSDWVGGGVADQLRWCVNFLNNWTPKKTQIPNSYANLKTQCYFELKQQMEKRTIRVEADGEVKESLQRELDNILVKDNLKEQKIRLESKEEMKKRLGNSPDYADAIMMRMYFIVANLEWWSDHTEIFTVDYSGVLY